MQALGSVPSIGKGQRKSKMRNPRISQIETTLYLHKEIASSGVREHKAKALLEFVERMNRHADYYRATATMVESTFGFLTEVISAWYPVADGAVLVLEETSKEE